MTTHATSTRLGPTNWTTDRDTTLLAKLALALGFFALAGGVLAAYRNPAEGAELSIYAATPLAFWMALAFSLLVALALSLLPTLPSWIRATALGLGVLSGAALVGLPLIRGYYFFGAGDSLTHLGWVKDMVAGRLDPLGFMYPATHLLAAFIGEGAGVSARRAILLMVFAYAVVPFVFVPLCMRQFTDRRWTVPVGLFSALLLLPINNVSVHLMAHPTTQAILVAPFVLYLLFRYLRLPVADRSVWGRASAWGVPLALATVSFLFVHPQQAVSLLLVFVTVAFVTAVLRRVDHERGFHVNPPYAQTLLFGALVLFWLPRHVRATGAVEAVVGRFLSGEGDAGGTVAHQSSSLAQVGGSIEELFLKLFLVTLVYVLLATALALVSLRDWRSTDSAGESFVQYVTLAGLPLGALFLLYFLSGVTRQHYRQVGFIVMLVTVLGGVAIVRGASYLSGRYSTRSVAAGLGVGLAVALVLSVPVLYPSPYMYQPTEGVSEAELEGYAFSFEHGADHPYLGVRGGPDRAIDALYGTVGRTTGESPTVGEGATPDVFNSGAYAAYYQEDQYLVVTKGDVRRERDLWDGLRYTADGFERLEERPGVNRVYSNGDVATYLIRDRPVSASSDGAERRHRSAGGTAVGVPGAAMP